MRAVWAVALVVLSTFDILVTRSAIAAGVASEANPVIAAHVMAPWFLAVKIVGVGLVAAAWYRWGQARWLQVAMVVAVVWYGAVAIWNVAVIM